MRCLRMTVFGIACVKPVNTFSSSIFEYEWNIWICKWDLKGEEEFQRITTQLLVTNTQSYFMYGLTRTWHLLLIAYYSHFLLSCLSKMYFARIRVKEKMMGKGEEMGWGRDYNKYARNISPKIFPNPIKYYIDYIIHKCIALNSFYTSHWGYSM